jgi:exodeoxyribonuclease VII large subunit
VFKSNLAISESFDVFLTDQIYTVSTLSGEIKHILEGEFQDIKLQGEVSGLKRHTSGHTYLSLKDEKNVIKAICWRGTKISCQLEDGIQIVAKGRVTVYSASSQYQFIIEEASVAGEGALLRLLNERKKRFLELGYFDKKRAPLPKMPKKIGIITSKSGAVQGDMIRRLEDRYPFQETEVIFWYVNVQGAEASTQVSSAIAGFNGMDPVDRPDVLIVARGGGSIEDLWPFNEENVVKATFLSGIPVVSAIGHEPDVTLIDYAADLRASTPTAAIDLSTPVLREIRSNVDQLWTLTKNIVQKRLNEKTSKKEIMFSRLTSSKYSLLSSIQSFDDRIEKMELVMKNYLQKQSLKLSKMRLIGLSGYLALKHSHFQNKKEMFIQVVKKYVFSITTRFENRSMRLTHGSYTKILEKGFCFITDTNEKTVQSAKMFREKQKENMIIHFIDGKVYLSAETC